METGSRKFYQPDNQSKSTQFSKSTLTFNEKCRSLAENLYEKDKSSYFPSPFHPKLLKMTYLDHTASSRPIKAIENYISTNVYPYYANTHTTVSRTSKQTTYFKHEAKNFIRNSLKLSEHQAIVFTGHGATSAVNRLVYSLGQKYMNRKIVVFVSVLEHHSNVLPWKGLNNCEVIFLPTDQDNNLVINLNFLTSILNKFLTREKGSDNHDSRSEKGNYKIICSFSAASNITGQIQNFEHITNFIKSISKDIDIFWDFATAAQYCPFDGKKIGNGCFISPHKVLGGVNTPGLLICDKILLENNFPLEKGGGAVFYVREGNTKYLKDVEMKEEAGTPDVVGSIRAGLVFKLRNDLGISDIYTKSLEIFDYCHGRLSRIKNLEILNAGSETTSKNSTTNDLPIFSFLIKDEESSLYLHHNYVSTLLNDLFGLQTRSGCMCAGPLAQKLLGIDHLTSIKFEKILSESDQLNRTHIRRINEGNLHECLRPGFSRISLPFYMMREDVDFVIDAIEMVCREGWKLLSQYNINPETAEFTHFKNKTFKERIWLDDFDPFTDGTQINRSTSCSVDTNSSTSNNQEILGLAKIAFSQAEKVALTQKISSEIPDNTENLRYWLHPSEAYKMLLRKRNKNVNEKLSFPISPFYIGSKIELSSEQMSVDEIFEKVQVKFKNFGSVSVDRNIGQGQKNEKEISEEVCTDGACLLPRKKPKIDQKLSSPTVLNNNNISKFHNPPKNTLFKPFLAAINEFKMINNNDRILIGLSGGKDSLTLLHLMKQYQHMAANPKRGREKINFKIAAVTVDPMTDSYDPSPLIPYLKELGIEYFYEKQDIISEARRVKPSSICSFCSRLKRGRLYKVLERENFNVLALGQHLDDLAESFLMGAFYNGNLQTMKVNYKIKSQDYINKEQDTQPRRVIRPLCYIREINTRNFAEKNNLPIIPENCPACFEDPKERHRLKQLLANQELLFPRLFDNLKTAIVPLMRQDKTCDPIVF